MVAVRRGSQSFSRGISSFRGVTAHPSGVQPSSSGSTLSLFSSVLAFLVHCLLLLAMWRAALARMTEAQGRAQLFM